MVIDAAELYKLNLNEGRTLTKISRYSLNRIQDEVRIDVHTEYQNPHGGVKAIPVDPGGRKARVDLMVVGENVDSALKNLTDMIKDMSYDKIYPEEG